MPLRALVTWTAMRSALGTPQRPPRGTPRRGICERWGTRLRRKLMLEKCEFCGRDRIVIVDDLARHQTRCYIRNAELEETARRHWKHRVGVSGRIISTDH